MRLESIALTHQGLIRDSNQDSILALPDVGLFTVADGMGGEKAGDEASQQVVRTIQTRAGQFFRNAPESPGQLEELARQTLQEASRDVFQISVRDPGKRGLGSTASLLCLHRGAWFISHVGDSRVYLVRGGLIRQLTRDHTVVWELYEHGRITREELEHHPERHLLTQCIGVPAPLKIDALQGSIQLGDLFLLCSDGLTGYVEESRIHAILRSEEPDLAIKANTLLNEALRAGGGDNISVLLVRVAALEDVDDWGRLPERGTSVVEGAITQAIDHDAVTQNNEETVESPPGRLPDLRPRKPSKAELSLSLLLTVLLLYLALYF